MSSERSAPEWWDLLLIPNKPLIIAPWADSESARLRLESFIRFIPYAKLGTPTRFHIFLFFFQCRGQGMLNRLQHTCISNMMFSVSFLHTIVIVLSYGQNNSYPES